MSSFADHSDFWHEPPSIGFDPFVDDNPFEVDPVHPNGALLEGLETMVLAAISADWAELSMSPEAVAERVAQAIAPVIAGTYDEDEIKGQAWSAR